MSLSRPTVFTKSENCPSEVPPTAGRRGTLSSEPPLSATLHEAILASSSRVRDSLPEQHRAHFETLRQEIIDFAQAHGIPRESLTKPDALREAASKLSTPDLTQLAILLERFEYLLKNKEPKKEDFAEALEYAEEFYHLERQYTSQVSLLEQVGILKDGVITGIDGKEYSVPTLEQIASRLFERREELETKYDQGFTKLLLVPFGMSLDALQKIFKRFLLSYKQKHPDFDISTGIPFWTVDSGKADVGEFPKLVYYPKSFIEDDHQGRTKLQILEEQEDSLASGKRWTLPPTAGSATGGTASAGVAEGGGSGSPGWTIHLFQSSDTMNKDFLGFAPIPRKGEGHTYGEKIPRKDFEAGRSPNDYLFALKESPFQPHFPYFEESGMTPEDWIMAFITHLTEMGRPLDDFVNVKESQTWLIGSLFAGYRKVIRAYWSRGDRHVTWQKGDHTGAASSVGVRTSVIV